ncbi:PorP/SprF family type IX secretion system membrane protein [Pedobacter sp. JY14-1]|uniref:PorP/SprF family type IX secretion system membrane protein n=1 Tax=Pedobacter sp. JY14-1 TaxID=3034151 RepID=UPI0023E113C0|nr:PorP/SprF family type IX secretion system membrane protein [Pedobacter sp. JY14-1]
MKLRHILLFIAAPMFVPLLTSAQLNPPAGQYFFNQYLANPAMGGLRSGLTFSAMIRKQFSNTPGGPMSQSLTGEYQLSPRAAIGVNLFNDKAGLLRQTKGFGTFSYHIPLNVSGSHLHFGLGAGFMNERINPADIQGDIDPSVARLNDRETFLDGSFGIAFTSSAFSLQAAVPHLKQVFAREQERITVDRALLFSAAAYRFSFEEGMDSWFVEPKAAFRLIKGADHIVDAGVQVGLMQGRLRFLSVYHSSKAASFGFGFSGLSGLDFQAIYTAPTTATTRGLGNNFEVNVAFHFPGE